ncbi:four helix bundle protein [Flavobacterium terrisoli]|uniref:four helix bundle protein n=1 Tax=Flavobacterium terrisoli TaxID=3242195 RepID=UPI0025427BCE|nr:four helix bundle protein [Flavobacterium buctense]
MKDNLIANKTFDFALSIIDLYIKLKKENEFIISKQIVRSGTSIGANVEEAIAGQSKKDFISKLSIASKEARETKYWLRLLDKSELIKIDMSIYLTEVEHIINILTKIIKTTQENK